MCRLPLTKIWLFAMLFAGLMPRLALAEIVQEKLGADGFPASWGPAEFAVGVSGTEVSASGITAVTPTKVRKQAWDTDAYGILKPGRGGVAPQVWRQMSRAEAEMGLNRALAKGVASPALRDAWRRVLLTEAAPPLAGAMGNTESWLAVRSGALEKLGFYEANWALWHGIEQDLLEGDEASALAWVQSRMLAGEGETACAYAKAEAVDGDDRGLWAPVMAACQLVGKGRNPAAVQLSLQVVEKQLQASNPTLLKILEAVTDGRVVSALAGPRARVDALGGAVLGQYPALIGYGIMPRVPDLALRRVAGSASLPNEMRGAAAVALAGQTGMVEDGQMAWALVSDTTMAGDLPDAVVVARGVEEASGTYVTDYVPAALRLGMVTDAAKALPMWKADPSETAVVTRARVQARLALGVLQGKVADDAWDEWIVLQMLENTEGAKRAQRTLLVAEALGLSVPQRIWSQLHARAVAVSTSVDPAWQRLLAEAVAAKNVPQVLVLISDAWKGEAVAEVAPVVAGASVEALRRSGFADLAVRVAAEAMLGTERKPVVVLKPQEEPKSVAEEVSRTKVKGLNSIGLQPKVEQDEAILPPPRDNSAPRMTVPKPTVTAPRKPTAPKAEAK